MAGTDQRNDRSGLHEKNMAARAGEKRPGAVTERGRGTKRDERVHVRLADFDLPPGTAIKGGTAENLHHPRKRERAPLKPRRHRQIENPFAGHEDAGDGETEAKLPGPGIFLRSFAAIFFQGNFFRFITGGGDGRQHGGHIFLGGVGPVHGRRGILQIHGGTLHRRDALNGLGDMACAVVASHAADAEFGCGGGRHFFKGQFATADRLRRISFSPRLDCAKKFAGRSNWL